MAWHHVLWVNKENWFFGLQLIINLFRNRKSHAIPSIIIGSCSYIYNGYVWLKIINFCCDIEADKMDKLYYKVYIYKGNKISY